jgi:hypothetical protein
MSRSGIGKPIFVELLMQFLEDSGYEVIHNGKKVEFPLDFAMFFRRLWLFIISTVAAAKRVTFAHLFEMEFVPSKRKEDQSVLRMRAHSSITKHFKAHPEQVYKQDDLSFDSVHLRSYDAFNSIVESQSTIRDSIVVTTETSTTEVINQH